MNDERLDGPVEQIREAIERGDWRRGRDLLRAIDTSALSDEERSEFQAIRDLITIDPAATLVAVGFSIFLLIVAIALRA